MERNQYRRINKPHRPALNDYIEGRVKLEELVSSGRITKPQERHNKQALLASINSIDNKSAATSNRIRYKTEKSIPNGKPLSNKSSHHSRSKHETTKTVSGSGSLISERSAQGDTSRSNVKVYRSLSTVSKTDSVLLEKQLNDRENEITKLKGEIANLRTAQNADVVSKLQKLIDDLCINDQDPSEPLPNDCDILTERLGDGVRTLRICHEATQQRSHEKDKKLAQFRADNEHLQKRVFKLESDLKKMEKEGERQYRELLELQTQNEKLRADLETSKKTYALGVGLCAQLQKFIQLEFGDKLLEMQNYDKNLKERVEQLQNLLDKLKDSCQQHMRWMTLRPQNEIERLKAEIRASEATKMQQMCEVTAELVDQGKTNEQLSRDAHQYKAYCNTLAIENRGLKDMNRYLQRRNEALDEVCRKQIETLPLKEKLKTLATFEKKTFDAEKAYSEELSTRTEEIKRVASKSSIE